MAQILGGPITTGSFSLGLVAGLVKYADESFKQFDTEYDKIFNVIKTEKAWERIATVSGLGLPSQLREGDSVVFDSMRERYNMLIPMLQYATGFIITKNAIDDNKSAPIAKLRGSELGRVMALQKECLAGLFLDNVFSTSLCGDGGALAANNHGILSGTFSNVPSAPAALSEVSLEQAFVDIRVNFVDERGLRIRVRPKRVIVPAQTEHEAERIFGAKGQVHSADVNTPSAMLNLNDYPEKYMVSTYMNSTTNWHVLTDQNEGEKGLIFYNRQDPTTLFDNVFDNLNLRTLSVMRLAIAAFGPRCIYSVNA